MALITGFDVDGGSSAVAGIADLSASPAIFDCQNIGPNTVVLTVTDNLGASATCQAIITIEDNILPDVAENPTMSTAKAVKQASRLMGGRKSKVSIYVNPSKSKPPSEME